MSLHSQTKRRLIHGGNTIAIILIVAGILIGVNYLTSKYNKRFDLTENQLFSISDQTVNVLDSLETEIKVEAFLPDPYAAGIPYEQAKRTEFIKDLLIEYDQLSEKVSVEFLNPDKEPLRAKNAGIQAIPALVMKTSERDDIIYGYATDEQEVTSRIVKLTSNKVNTIAVVKNKRGHESEKDMRGLKQALESYGYSVEDVDLIEKSSLDDYSLVIVSGPQIDFNKGEMYMLDKYIYEGGKVIFAIDPMTNSRLEDLIASYGVTLEDNVVLDTKNHYFNPFAGGRIPSWPIITDFSDFMVVKNFNNLILPQIRSLNVNEDIKNNPDYVVDEFMKTSINSWAEYDLTTENAEFTEGTDKKGPFVEGVAITGKFESYFKDVDVAALSENADIGLNTETPEDSSELVERGESGEARMIVMGDSDFMTDQHIRNANNGDLILNSVNWMLEDEDLITINAKEAESRKIETMTKGVQNLVFWLNIVAIPILVILFGLARMFFVRYQRNRL